MKATQIPSVNPMPAPFLSDKAFRIYCPKSSVPINAPIITMNSANTIVWFKPSIIWGNAIGNSILNKSGELEEIKKGDVVYIKGNAEHALKNNGKETLEFYWIFPTDRFSEVEYISKN